MPAVRSPGRPREFDTDTALRGAMELFHERGYDSTTLADLLAAMGGISPPSFYAAFGSKEKVFAEAVEMYQREFAAKVLGALEGGATARESIAGMLRAGLGIFTASRIAPGCLLVFGAVNSSSRSLETMLKDKRCEGQDYVRKRLVRGVAEGDVPKGAPVDAIVAFYATVMYGLAHAARDGMAMPMLTQVVDGAMGAWDALVAPSRKTRRTARRKSRTRGSR